MQTPAGPSIRLMLDAAGEVGDISVAALTALWCRWIGPQRFARKFAQLERAGLIEKATARSDVTRVIRLTEAGRLAALGGRDPVAHWKREWDGRWRMVLFDVQEAKRKDRVNLQRRLRRLNFGYLQDSVWITPDPVETLRRAIGALSIEAGTLTVLDARPCAGESDDDLVRGAWDFARINRCYDDYLEVLRSLPIASSARARRDWLPVEWKAWCRAVRSDPLLPEVLLPRGYRGRDAWERRQERMSRLLRRHGTAN